MDTMPQAENLEKMKALRAELLAELPADFRRRIDALLLDFAAACIEVGKDRQLLKMPAIPTKERQQAARNKERTKRKTE